MTEVLACIGLGSNQGNREQHLGSALKAIAELGQCRMDRCSQFYETPPWGITDQPSFLNCACGIYTSRSPEDLLVALKEIELAHGRTRELKWGPRTLDLDIICFGDLRVQSHDLQLPHTHFEERRFVLEPLAEIYPELLIEGLSVKEHLRNLPD